MECAIFCLVLNSLPAFFLVNSDLSMFWMVKRSIWLCDLSSMSFMNSHFSFFTSNTYVSS